MTADLPTPDARPYDRRFEVESLLSADDTVLGHYYAYSVEGLTPQEMTAREGVNTTGWTSVYKSLLKALTGEELPTSPSQAKGAAARFRTWLKRDDLSPELRQDLEHDLKALATIGESQEAVAAETEAAVQVSKRAEAAGTPGVYVWSLPHYLNYPVDPKRRHTFYKVGHSSVDAYSRVRDSKWVGLPEDPVLLRIYPASASAESEKRFHGFLRAADHFQQHNAKAGAEWYLTSLKYLDFVAQSLGLEVQEYNANYEAGTE